MTAQLALAGVRTRVIEPRETHDLYDLFELRNAGSRTGSRLSIRITYARWRQVGVGHGRVRCAARGTAAMSAYSMRDSVTLLVDAQSTRTQVQCLKCSVQVMRTAA